MEVIWLASYPRSGNTFLRTILWQCFGLRSGSIYPNDLGGNKELESYVGHIEQQGNGEIIFPPDSLQLVKTHEPPRDKNPAIYVARDGRDACVSLRDFYSGRLSLEAIIEGRHRFGTWSSHVQSWNPTERLNTLLLKYEEMREDLPGTLNKISGFLGRDALRTDLPPRQKIASVDGRWVKPKSDRKLEISGPLLEKFDEIGGKTLEKMGYPRSPQAISRNKEVEHHPSLNITKRPGSTSTMDEQYLMGSRDTVRRTVNSLDKATVLTPGLRLRLLAAAIQNAFEFYANFFERAAPNIDCDRLALEYEREFAHALSLGLFQPGGVREKDHLNFWCLGQVFAPVAYIESGVFIGSSLHAFLRSPNLEKVIGIDPNLKNLRVPSAEIPGATLIDDKDFSQIELQDLPPKTLAYFDDHIDTTDRILQASEKGLKYVLFDDSTGLEGICQRLYPAIPTIPMILNHSLLRVGDEMSWTHGMPKGNLKKGGFDPDIRLTLRITEELLDKCRRASSSIEKCQKIPDLCDYIPQLYPEPAFETTKFLVKLK